MKKYIVLLSIVIMAFSARADQSLLNTKAPDFSLRDQYDRSFTLQTFYGRPVILMACDKKASKQNGTWRSMILEKYGDRVQTAGVADLRTAPPFLSFFIKKDFKKDPVSILLDWDGALFTAYGLAQNVPNIILIDTNGFVRHLYSGSASPEAIGLLFGAVDDIMKKAP